MISSISTALFSSRLHASATQRFLYASWWSEAGNRDPGLWHGEPSSLARARVSLRLSTTCRRREASLGSRRGVPIRPAPIKPTFTRRSSPKAGQPSGTFQGAPWVAFEKQLSSGQPPFDTMRLYR